MKRGVLFVLLLALCSVMAGAQVKTEAQREQAPEAQVKSEAPQDQTEEAQTEVKASEGQTEEEHVQKQGDAKVISGMSILGNQEAPKSLVIVPWKSSEIGNSMDIETMLDDSRQPVDKEVFMRALRYYEIRSETKP